MDYNKIFDYCKATSLYGRYISLENIEPLLEQLNTKSQVSLLGKSVLQKPIYGYTVGTGKTKILLWSQMHGNESTTTKALFDLFNFFNSKTKKANDLLEYFTFLFIPILNPDGAELYTRENANGIDLNRDAQNLSQPESRILRETYQNFQPDYCYNLHDQRTIYAVGNTNKSATVSFLAPSFDEIRSVNASRKKAISIIAATNASLQNYIPNQIGRFDDAFNLNCVGDTFQCLGTPTILIEAGHFKNDYQREATRKYIFIALLSSFITIYDNDIVDNVIEDYMNIPQNNACFFDIVYKNIKINYDTSDIITNFAVQYKEELLNKIIYFNAFIVKIGDLEQNFGHSEIDGNGKIYTDNFENFPQLNQKADFFLGKHLEIVNGLIKS